MSPSPVYIGVDVSKLVLAVHGPGLRPEYPNTPQGHSAILKALPLGAHVVMEATGDYQREFVLALHGAAFKLTVANPRHVRDFAKAMGEWAKTDKIDAADDALRAKSERLRQVDGVGPIVAATLLAHMPELGEVSRNEASALLGVAPFACESGPRKGARQIYGGRAALRTAIYMAALTAARKNPILKAFYKKLKATKPFKVAIVAVMRKLIMLLNHLLKNPDFSLAS